MQNLPPTTLAIQSRVLAGILARELGLPIKNDWEEPAARDILPDLKRLGWRQASWEWRIRLGLLNSPKATLATVVDSTAQRHAFAVGLVLGALPFLAAYLVA